NLEYAGTADTAAPAGQAGTLLLDPKNLIISAAPAGVLPQFNYIDPHPTAGAGFGTSTTVLSTGNVVVANPTDNLNRRTPAAAYLFHGLTGALLSALVGGGADDRVGQGVTALANGNYVVISSSWDGQRGAATWGSGTAGVTSAVSVANSLVGANANDRVGSGVTALANGNYVVTSPSLAAGPAAAPCG